MMFFHNPTPKALIGSREYHPPHKLPNLESTATLHHASLSIPNCHNLPNIIVMQYCDDFIMK
jgi:hypothetical protein